MEIELITKSDLQAFRLQLLEDIRQMMNPPSEGAVKPWLKNCEVRQLLKVSANTIQRLRIAGKLRSSKVGGTHYYKYDDIVKLMG